MPIVYKPRKIYRIRIVHNYAMKNVWYANKIGQEFDAHLVRYGNGDPVFRVADAKTVNQLDCVVISERVEK